jgi:hypothetical protein
VSRAACSRAPKQTASLRKRKERVSPRGRRSRRRRTRSGRAGTTAPSSTSCTRSSRAAKTPRSARAFASSLPAGVDEEQFKAAAKSAGAAAVERINGVGNRGRTLAGLVLVSDFSNAAIRLTTSSPRSDVIHTSYGSHIVLLLGRAEPEPFVPSERASGLREEAMNRRVRARIAEQRGKFAVEVRQEALQSLEIPAPSP